MKRKPVRRRDNFATLLFGLSDASVRTRNNVRMFAGMAAWLVLSGITWALTIYPVENPVDETAFPINRILITIMSFLKYIPLIAVAYSMAKSKAAHYLDDIFELHDQTLAEQFIEEVAFGGEHETITINEGRISEKDERSPIILVGGPGQIKVNLGSAALLEKLDGEPEVIHARSEPWHIGRFERIREIGKDDEVGKREYAAINLRDQFVSGLSVKSRTKDGIPIEAQEIKLIFSILRDPKMQQDHPESNPYSFDEQAVKDLVYKQTIITPPPSTVSGVTFPWDTSVIPLVIYEIEKLITSSTLSEILVNISQKELDTISKEEETLSQKRVEMTGIQAAANQNNATPPNFMSRNQITAKFYSEEFKKKAAEIGVAIHWIDIGTWHLPSGIILENLKQAWNLARENARKRGAVKRSKEKQKLDILVELVNSVIIFNYDRNTSAVRLTEKDIAELAKAIDNNPEVIGTPRLRRQIAQQNSKRDTHTIATEMLKAFRREMIAARELIQKEDLHTLEEQEALARIEKALKDINHHLSPHYIKKNT